MSEKKKMDCPFLEGKECEIYDTIDKMKEHTYHTSKIDRKCCHICLSAASMGILKGFTHPLEFKLDEKVKGMESRINTLEKELVK